MLVECQLSRIVLRDTGDSQFVYLREKDGPRSFPIVIGIFEAVEIRRKVNGETTARPLTHDLVRNVLEALGARLVRIVVNEIKNDVFHARLHIESDQEEKSTLSTVDCRPSDAIALSVATDAPIFVEESVLDTMAQKQ